MPVARNKSRGHTVLQEGGRPRDRAGRGSLSKTSLAKGGGRVGSRLPLSPDGQRIELRIRYVDTTVIGANGVLFENDSNAREDAD
jgi:hypothetical protein